MKWAYGVTTVEARFRELLPRTLKSLAGAGFPEPRLFVDGAILPYGRYQVTLRSPAVKPFGNWLLALMELYIREPTADRYAIFQDDLVTYKNLRQYLERWYPDNGYLNLFTSPANQSLAPPEPGRDRWFLSNQYGRGAVGLVFNRDAVVFLLTHSECILRPQNGHNMHKSIDGAVILAMKSAGRREYVHTPSLVQHTGDVSTMESHPQKPAEQFLGEEFDCVKWL